MGSKALIKWSKNITPSQVEQLIRAEKDIQKAILLFNSATAEYSNGFRHDLNTFGLIISRLADANQFRLAEQFLTRMEEEKCNFSEDIFLSICRAYGKAHKPLDALRVFQKMKEFQCEPTQKSYITIFAILVGENQLKLAHRFYHHMKEVGIPHSVASLNILIKAFCKSSGTLDAAFRVFRKMPEYGCIPDSYTYGTLISGLCKLGKISEAKELFKEMSTKGCSRTVITYNSLIHGLCLSNNLDEAMDLLAEMRSNGIEPNMVTYNSSMDGLCKGGRSSQAMDLLDKMVSEHHLPNRITYSTLIDGLCKEEKIWVALEILDRMKLQGCKPDAGLYSKVINGLCATHKFQEAANLLDEMILCGISPNRVTRSVHVKMHNVVVQGLCIDNVLDRAFLMYLRMHNQGISTDLETLRLLVLCFCKKGDIFKAARIVDETIHEGCVPDEGIWSTIVGGFWGRRKVREAAESIQDELLSEVIVPKSES